MLILTRKPGQSIVIYNPHTQSTDVVDIVVQEVRGQQVKLGISAPHHIAIDRKEIAKLKRENNAR